VFMLQNNAKTLTLSNSTALKGLTFCAPSYVGFLLSINLNSVKRDEKKFRDCTKFPFKVLLFLKDSNISYKLSKFIFLDVLSIKGS